MRYPSNQKLTRRARVLTGAVLIGAVLTSASCVPLAATGIALGAMAVIDRRTIGAQTEDQTIEIKAVRELRAVISDPSAVSITSYNRRVLLTGQALTAVDKQNAGAAIAGLANVRGVYNELEIATESNLAEAAGDTTLTTKVKTALLRDEVVPGNSVKVKTESAVVYLLGLVTNEEAARAAEVASQVGGVGRVVTVFEILSDAEARRLTSDALEQPPEGPVPGVPQQPTSSQYQQPAPSSQYQQPSGTAAPAVAQPVGQPSQEVQQSPAQTQPVYSNQPVNPPSVLAPGQSTTVINQPRQAPAQ